MVYETMKLSNVFKRENRILLHELVVTDFKLRYQGSTLGYLWSVIKPIFLFAILYVVFGIFMRGNQGIDHYPVYLLLGIVLWSFFAEATSQGLQSIVARGDLIRKINFPKYIIIISGTISALINLAINLVVVAVFMLINGVTFSWSALMVVPLVIELYVFALGIASLLSAMNVKYRDVGYLWEIFLQAAFYATPILYALQMVQSIKPSIAQLLLLNPAAQIIQDARYFLVTDKTLTLFTMSHWWKELIPLCIVLVVLLAGVVYFKKHSKNFAEEI